MMYFLKVVSYSSLTLFPKQVTPSSSQLTRHSSTCPTSPHTTPQHPAAWLSRTAQAALARRGLALEPFRPGAAELGVVVEALPEVSLGLNFP